MKRSPWFNARRDPPVNGRGNAVYERRCLAYPQMGTWESTRANIVRSACDLCQWRGMLQEKAK